jgi:zinc protease
VEIAATILGEQPAGRLYKALVEPGKAAEIGAGTLRTMDPGVMLAYAAIRLEKPMDDVQAIMLSVLDELKSNPFTDEEVNRSKTQFAKSFEL